MFDQSTAPISVYKEWKKKKNEKSQSRQRAVFLDWNGSLERSQIYFAKQKDNVDSSSTTLFTPKKGVKRKNNELLTTSISVANTPNEFKEANALRCWWSVSIKGII